jgi:hypothetical protein
MSLEQLAGLDAERAFFPRGRFHELPLDYVPFDELAGEAAVDGRIDRAFRAEAGAVTVVASSGAGKSAAISAAAHRLSSEFACVRVPVAAVGHVAASPVAFGQHVLRETVRRAHDQMRPHQHAALQAASTDRTVVTEGGGQAGVAVKLGIPGLSVDVAGDLKESGLDREHHANASTVLEGLNRLVDIFEVRERSLILVVEDTDAWLGGPDGEVIADVAEGFFSETLAMLVRDLELRVIVATHTRCVSLDGYQRIRPRLLAEVEIPPLAEPETAIGAILQKRIAVSEVEARVEDVFSGDAIARLVAEYDHSGRSIRHVLQVCDTALEHCSPSFPAQLSGDHLRGASVALRGGS